MPAWCSRASRWRSACHQIFGLCRHCAFEDPIVRLVFKNVESESWTKDSRDLTYFLNRFSCFVFRPVKLCLEDSGCFGED